MSLLDDFLNQTYASWLALYSTADVPQDQMVLEPVLGLLGEIDAIRRSDADPRGKQFGHVHVRRRLFARITRGKASPHAARDATYLGIVPFGHALDFPIIERWGGGEVGNWYM